MKKRNETGGFTGVIILVLIIIGIFIVLLLKEGNLFSKSDRDSNTINSSETKEGEEGELVDPAPGTLDIAKVQGFKSSALNSSGGTESAETPSSAIMLSDSKLKVEAVGRYSGDFIEDGSDEPIDNVAALLITNNSEQMLQIAEITFQVNDDETAFFKITDIPSGTSALVLEANKREFRAEDSYIYGETVTGYMEQPTLEEDKFELVTEKGKITLKNKTDKSYEKIYVYYKSIQLGGAYLGGITYRTPIENVLAGDEVEAIARHFDPDTSKIMAVQILE